MLDELTRAFAIFARNGRWIDWVYVRRVLDRSEISCPVAAPPPAPAPTVVEDGGEDGDHRGRGKGHDKHDKHDKHKKKHGRGHGKDGDD